MDLSAFEFEPPVCLTGPDKAAQQFIIELLTVRGSVRWQKSRGCGFLLNLRRAINEFDIFAAYAAARNKLRAVLRSLPAKCLDERFRDAVLDDIAVHPDGTVVLGFVVTVASNETRYIETPLLTVGPYGSAELTSRRSTAESADLAADDARTESSN